jgi:hypothetical protein
LHRMAQSPASSQSLLHSGHAAAAACFSNLYNQQADAAALRLRRGYQHFRAPGRGGAGLRLLLQIPGQYWLIIGGGGAVVLWCVSTPAAGQRQRNLARPCQPECDQPLQDSADVPETTMSSTSAAFMGPFATQLDKPPSWSPLLRRFSQQEVPYTLRKHLILLSAAAERGMGESTLKQASRSWLRSSKTASRWRHCQCSSSAACKWVVRTGMGGRNRLRRTLMLYAHAHSCPPTFSDPWYPFDRADRLHRQRQGEQQQQAAQSGTPQHGRVSSTSQLPPLPPCRSWRRTSGSCCAGATRRSSGWSVSGGRSPRWRATAPAAGTSST